MKKCFSLDKIGLTSYNACINLCAQQNKSHRKLRLYFHSIGHVLQVMCNAYISRLFVHIRQFTHHFLFRQNVHVYAESNRIVEIVTWWYHYTYFVYMRILTVFILVFQLTLKTTLINGAEVDHLYSRLLGLWPLCL